MRAFKKLSNSTILGGLLKPKSPGLIASAIQLRFLNIHEYQSKMLMDKYGVTTQRWRLAETPDQAEKAAIELDAEEFVIKAQIHAGGRGKGTFDDGFKGGVHLCKTPKEAKDLTGKMLGKRLVTKQTSKEGVEVKKVIIVESINIKTETYFAIVMDRAFGGPVLVGSHAGGMDIEELAEKSPEFIHKSAVSIKKGPTVAQTERLAKQMGFTGRLVSKAAEEMRALYDLFIKTDATQVEINPFAVDTKGRIYSVDAKINFDDNAAFRQQKVFSMRDEAEEDPREVAASKFDLSYIGMDGNIGCMVNGAGLAMATMDIIKLYKGEPANFLDVGGGATVEKVTEAFKILTGDSKVKAILVNIFGGIMRCDVIAQGIVAAAKQVKLEIPLVVRLAGTNVELGKKILAESGLRIVSAEDLDDAAQKAVKALK